MSDDTLQVGLRHEPDRVIVAVTGELDEGTAPELRDAVGPVTPGTRVVLDLRRLAFMDSAGIHLLMHLDVRARSEGWRLGVAVGTGIVGRVLQIVRLADRVEVVEDPDELR